MMLVLVAIGVTFSGICGVSAESWSNSDQQMDVFQKWTERVEVLEGKVQKMGELESRVKTLEAIVRRQTVYARSQGRKLALFEQLLKQSKKARTMSKEPPVGMTGATTTESTSSAEIADVSDVVESTKQERDTRAVMQEQLTVRRGIRAAEGGVAFSAYLDHNIGPLGEHQVVKFNHIQLNDGNGYNQYAGHFICPRTGVYFFIYHMGHQGIGQTWLELVANNNRINSATVQGYRSDKEGQGGNSAIVQLSAGDTVWVDAWATGPVSHDSTVTGSFRLTTFSGFLLY